MKLSPDQIKKVAKLASLELSEEEMEVYSGQLSAILDYIDQLEKVDTKAIEPIYNITMRTNVTQEDKVSNSLTQEAALANASNKKDGYFVTKGIFNE